MVYSKGGSIMENRWSDDRAAEFIEKYGDYVWQ